MPNLPDIHGSRILIVDDCRDTGSVLCELLAWMGYEHVASTTDGKVLLGADGASRYGLVLLDMHLPGVGGLEIVRSLCGKESRHCVPVITISGDQRYRTRAIEAGACAFLMKPFSQGDLEATIFNALSSPCEHMV